MNVFYRPEQCAQTDSFSPSAAKPAMVVADWLSRPEIGARISSFEPAPREVFYRAHSQKFVDAVLDLRQKNGFGNNDASVALSLPYTTGSLLAASRHALENASAACSPTSGFHHAGWDSAVGFCTFNGLMACALALRAEHPALRVGIIDCDAHYGNGTDDIRQKLGIGWIEHWTMGRVFNTRSDADGGKFEQWLDRAIRACSGCDLVLYQAGADPHLDDPYGGMLTSEQMNDRDLAVFSAFPKTPLAWCLAGGYQTIDGLEGASKIEPVLALHRATALAHRAVYG